MKEAEVILLFKCLSDKSRLHIVKSLAMEDMYVERLAERLNLSASTISFHLKKLAEAGIVSSYKTQYRKYRHSFPFLRLRPLRATRQKLPHRIFDQGSLL